MIQAIGILDPPEQFPKPRKWWLCCTTCQDSWTQRWTSCYVVFQCPACKDTRLGTTVADEWFDNLDLDLRRRTLITRLKTLSLVRSKGS